MADQIILLTREDADRASTIIDAFAERTGLDRHDIEGGASFPLRGLEHETQITRTLTDIDPEWATHITLGDPSGASAD